MKKAILALVIIMLMAVTVRATDLEERWVYTSTNLMYDANADALVKLIGQAHDAGVTHIHLSDYQSAMLSAMGPHYFMNVEKVKKAAKEAGIVIAPMVFSIGSSGRYLYHNPNLADGIPVRDMRFVVKNGEAVVDPSLTPEIVNGGFDKAENGAPAGWRMDIGRSAIMSRSETDEGDTTPQEVAIRDAALTAGLDSVVKHSGAASFKVSVGSDARSVRRLRAGVSQVVKVKPFHAYRLSVWMKTEGVAPERHPVQVYGARDKRQLSFLYFMRDTEANWPPINGSTDSMLLPAAGAMWTMAGTDFGPKPTGDWAQYKVAFNSLDYDEIELFAGCSRVGKGTIWFDDIELEPAGLLNLLRRELTPLTVTNADGSVTYTEGADYQHVEDPLLGEAPSRGDFSAVAHGTFEIWHQGPSIKLAANSRIKDGDTLLVSFYSPGIIYVKQQVTVSLSDPAVFDLMEQEMKEVQRVWGSSCYIMGYDEIRSGGWEPQPGGAHLTSGQLLANHMKRAVEIGHKYAPNAKFYVWSDMFDPNHNARELKEGQHYYLVNGSWAGSWEGLPSEVIIYNWSGSRESARWFAGRGHQQILSGGSPERWLGMTNGMPGILGMSYTNWEGDYSKMGEYFGAAKAWKPAVEGGADVQVESTGK